MDQRRDFTSLEDHARDFATRKETKKSSKPSSRRTPPRKVFTKACERIARYFAGSFKYSKSKFRLTANFGDLTANIYLRPGKQDVPGQYVHMHVFLTVHSRKLKRARADYMASPKEIREGRFVGVQLGHLLPERTWREWNLLPNTNAAADDVCESIDLIAIPFLTLFEDEQSFQEAVRKGEIPHLEISNAIEYLLAQGDRDGAIALARDFLERHPNRLERYRTYVEAYSANKPPEWWSSSLAQLALIGVTLGLEFDPAK